MIFKESSNPKEKFKFTKGISDYAIIYWFMTGLHLELLWNRTDKFFIEKFNELKGFLSSIYATFITYPLHLQHGKRQIGLIALIAGTSCLLAVNSIHVWPGWSSIGFLFIPIIATQSTWQEIHQYVFVDIRSFPLLIHSLVYFGMGLFNLACIYCGRGNADNSKRGNSIIVVLILISAKNGKRKVNEFLISVIEVSLIAILGLIFWNIYGDYTYAVTLWVSGFAELGLHLRDRAYQDKKEAYLNV
ncbi:MAG: hypothetical protein AAFY41_01395 [Bacteroidota bacterium]